MLWLCYKKSTENYCLISLQKYDSIVRLCLASWTVQNYSWQTRNTNYKMSALINIVQQPLASKIYVRRKEQKINKI